MAEVSSIEWTDATVNFWWGCTKVGPGCEHCYAEAWSRRTGEQIFGQGVPRRKIKSALKTLYRLHNDASWWSADAEIGKLHASSRRWVFIQSMSDLFDKEVPQAWFDEAWNAITACDKLNIQIVTKRVSFVEKRLNGKPWPKNAGLVITVVNQPEADRDVPRVLELKEKLNIPWVGLSMEPLLGPVDLRRIGYREDEEEARQVYCHASDAEPRAFAQWLDALTGTSILDEVLHSGERRNASDGPTTLPALDWIIVGVESGPGARPMHPDWARGLRDQCAAAGVPFFFKQWGEYLPCVTDHDGERLVVYSDGQEADAFESERRRPLVTAHSQEFWRVGKKAAGRLLDGVEHSGMPA